MEESVMLKKLHEFLSTAIRKDVFACYVINETSQSEVVSLLNNIKPKYTSTSTVERITSSLNFIGIIDKTTTRENRLYYKVNWHIWIQESLKVLGFDNVPEEKIAEIEEILSDKKLIAFYFALTSEDALKIILRKTLDKNAIGMLKKEGVSPDMFLGYMVKQGPGLSHLPLFYIINGNPMVKLWSKKFMDRKEDKKFVQLFTTTLNKALANNPSKAVFTEFNEKSLKDIFANFKKIEEVTKKLFFDKIKQEIKS